MKKIISIGIIFLFLLAGLSTVSGSEEDVIGENTSQEAPKKVYLRPKEIVIQGKGLGIKSFPFPKPFIIFYIIFINLKSSSPGNSYIKPVIGDPVYFQNGTILIIGSRISVIGINREINTNWYGFIHIRSLIGGNIFAYAESPTAVIFLK